MIGDSNTTTIRTLRVGGDGPDVLAQRLQIERELSAVRLSPPALSPTGILCVRRMRTRMRHRRGIQRPDDDLATVVEHSFAEATRTAHNPSHGPVPPHTDAVIFNDRAELLACLAHDWCCGNVAAHWWWRTLFPTSDLSSLAVQTWSEA